MGTVDEPLTDDYEKPHPATIEDESEAELEASLTRFLSTKSVPLYLREDAERWLAQQRL